MIPMTSDPDTRARPLRDALRDVLDPDTGISLIDLGLVYDVKLDEEGTVTVLMTLTSPACPASEVIIAGIERRLRAVAGVRYVQVDVTFEPPWTPDRITQEGRARLGW